MPLFMEIEELTQKMHEFVSTKGWYEAGSQRPQTPKNLAISLVLEASEVLELFQWQENYSDKQALAEELADVFLYLLQIAKLTDINLEEAVIKKLAINYNRTWE